MERPGTPFQAIQSLEFVSLDPGLRTSFSSGDQQTYAVTKSAGGNNVTDELQDSTRELSRPEERLQKVWERGEIKTSNDPRSNICYVS
jgi:hypothetical protein